MPLLNDLKMYGRFAWGLQGFLRRPISLSEAETTIYHQLAERESAFLRLVERGIYGYPRSPYLPLLKQAQVELSDIQAMLRGRGLEDTLGALREAGVYITYEEFKGRTPIDRPGLAMTAKPHDFDNPYLDSAYQVSSGGSTGAGTRVEMGLEHIATQTMDIQLVKAAHDILDAPGAVWMGILPDTSGLMGTLLQAHSGQVIEKWFSPFVAADLRPALKYRLATRLTVALARVAGVHLPWPELVRLDQAETVARWAADCVQSHGKCIVGTTVSLGLRLCLAAKEAGIDLTGVTLMGTGEPPTPAKVRGMTQVGARWLPLYAFTEAGLIGVGCVNPVDGNDMHFLKHALALIQAEREAPGAGMVPAFYFTTLLATSPKILLNVESDDFGVVETRACGCPLEAYGFTEHLREIYSFSKLTSEGATLIGSDMVRILEEVLPAKFGGSLQDYQLMEEEDDQGFTRLSLIVSPKVAIADERAVVEAVYQALRDTDPGANIARALWSQAGTLRVKRQDPIWSARGKLMPLHLARSTQRLQR